MPFDFAGRKAKREAEQKQKEQQGIAERNERNAVARDLCQDLVKFIDQERISQNVPVSVQGNIVTIDKAGDRLNVTVLGKITYGIREIAKDSQTSTSDLRNESRQKLNQNEMMDFVIEWLEGSKKPQCAPA
jgi:hypothetical protein